MDSKQISRKSANFIKTNSLRFLLVSWFVVASIVPLMFLTFYSVNKLEGVVKGLYQQTLKEQSEKISSEINGWVRSLNALESSIDAEKSLKYFLANRQYQNSAKEILKLVSPGDVDVVQIFDRNRKLVNYFSKTKDAVLVRSLEREKREYFLSQPVRSESDQALVQLSFPSSEKTELSIAAPIKTDKNRLIGFLLLVKVIDSSVVKDLQNKFNTDVIFYFNENVLSTINYSRMWSLSKGFVEGEFSKLVMIADKPYTGFSKVYKLGGESFKVVVLQSSASLVGLIENINYTFISVALLILLFMGAAWFLMTKTILRPIDNLISAISKMRNGEQNVTIQEVPNNELGMVVENFNAMSKQVLAAQGKLVHQAKMASLGELVAGIAHELNNAISFIYGNIEPLKDYLSSLKKIVKAAEKSDKDFKKSLKDEDYKFIEKDMPKLVNSISEGAVRTKNIVQGLKTFSRLDEGGDKQFDLIDSLKTTIELLPRQLIEKVDIKIDPETPVTIKGNPGQLNQVFMNLLINAAQSIKGSGEILISIKKQKNTVSIAFKDTGKGISADKLDRIFDPFYTTKSQGEGSGLGLSISYGIIESHNGDIKVQSKPGKGSIFTVTLVR